MSRTETPSDNQRKAWARLHTLTSFVSWICFARARRSDSESVNRFIVVPPTLDFTGDGAESVKKIMSTYLHLRSSADLQRERLVAPLGPAPNLDGYLSLAASRGSAVATAACIPITRFLHDGNTAL